MKPKKSVEPSQIVKGKRVIFRLLNRTNLGDVIEVRDQTVVTMAMRNGMTVTLPMSTIEKILGGGDDGNSKAGK